MRYALLFSIAIGCSRSEPIAAKPEPSVAPLPPPAPPPKPDVTRLKGFIEGKFTLSSGRVTVGEPIVAMLETRSTKGPIPIFVGGDQRNEAAFPNRISIVVTDEAGAVVCDSIEKPAVPNFGGLGSERTLKEGENYFESGVLNPMCPALSKPGKYKIKLHRRLAPMNMTIKKVGSAYPLSCDMYPVYEEALPKGSEPGCVPQMEALPSVTTETMIEVEPFAAAVLRTKVTAQLASARDTITRDRMSVWICGWLSCTCPKAPTDADLLAALPSTLPPKFPAPCRAP